jgi:hypothetical protein
MSLILSGSDGVSDIDGSASTPAIRGTDTNTGIFFPAVDTIAFAEGGAEVMRLDSSGRLGIGTTTVPAGGLLTLNRAPTAAFGSPILQIGGASFTSGGYYSVGLGFTDATYTEPPAEIAYVPTSDSGGTKGVIIFGNRDVTTNTAVSERMRIDSAGNLLVGTTGISTGTFKGIQCAVNSGGFPNYLSQNPAGTSTRRWAFGMNSADEYVVYGYNTTTFNTGAYIAWGGTSWTAQSDERSKDIIEPITDAANKVSTLRAVIGKYKTDEEGTRRSFLIAQDVQAVLPEAVDASKPDNLGVQYTEVIPLLVAAIKEQQAIITDLKSRIEALEAK